MSVHEAIPYGYLSDELREKIEGLSELVSLVHSKAAEHGIADCVVRVEVKGIDVQAAAYDRKTFQANVLASEPRDSAEDESFFVTLNDPVIGGFWVVLQLDTDPYEYLFQMVGNEMN